MSYLNHDEILELCRSGAVEHYDESCINAASLDVRLGSEIYCEQGSNTHRMVDYSKRQKLDMTRVVMPDSGIAVYPGQFFLAHTIEKFNLPDDVAALFRIKSSMGRVGLEHLDAGWVDPGFYGALTLEFKLVLERHWVLLRPGDRIGQLIFLRGNRVPEDRSYRVRGNYNGANGVKQVGYAT